MNRFNVIGDIHGRDNWKELLKEGATNIFVGDYFDPYDDISFEDMRNNFLEIIEAPYEKILLIGNHDAHYLYGEESSRFDHKNENQIRELLLEFEDQMQLTYASENYLVSHAGVGIGWYNRFISNVEKTPKEISKAINDKWKKKKYEYFQFETNRIGFDFCGTSKDHSCLWIRPQTLVENNVFEGTLYKQVIGHTQFNKIQEKDRIIFTDVLDLTTESFEFYDDI